MRSDLGMRMGERLGHRRLGELAFGPHRDRQLLAVISIRGTAEEQAAARRVLNAIARVGHGALDDEVAARRARRAANETGR